MGRKKRFKRRHIITFVFTRETINTAKQALKLLRVQVDVHIDGQDDRVAFAEEMMDRVSAKLDGMEQSVGNICVTGFDYNEKVILTQALKMYVAYLFSTPESRGRTRELQRCYQLSVYFTVEKLK